jgi:hypothetical protein
LFVCRIGIDVLERVLPHCASLHVLDVTRFEGETVDNADTDLHEPTLVQVRIQKYLKIIPYSSHASVVVVVVVITRIFSLQRWLSSVTASVPALTVEDAIKLGAIVSK